MTDLARILVGPLAWLAAFSAVYGLQGLGCALGWAGIDTGGVPLLRAGLAAAWLAAIALQAAILAGLYSRRFGAHPGFARSVSRMTGWVGLVATLWSLFPVVATSACQ